MLNKRFVDYNDVNYKDAYPYDKNATTTMTRVKQT